MELNDIINELESLQKWESIAGSYGRFGPSVDFDKEDDGDWIRVEDVDTLISKLKNELEQNK